MFGIEFDRPSRHDPHPHARGLGRPPAAQGLRRRDRAGAVQGCARPTPPTMTLNDTTRIDDRRPCRTARRRRPRPRLAAARRACFACSGGPSAASSANRSRPPPRRRPSEDDHQHGAVSTRPRTACCGSCSRLEGETVTRCKPIIGYLHTGMEKTGETAHLPAGPHQRHPHGLRLAAVHRAGVLHSPPRRCSASRCPPRAVWIRMLMCELNRMSSHLLFQATNGMDLGAVSMMLYGWREREEVLRFFEKRITGLRMNHNYIRPGGVAADLPDGWRDDVWSLLDPMLAASPRRVRRRCMTGQPIWRERLQGVGVDQRRRVPGAGAHRADPAQHGLRVGPAPPHAVPRLRRGRLRHHRRHLRRLLRPLRHPPQRDPRVDQDRAPDHIEKMPAGDYRIQDKKVTPPPRARIDESMEALIHHFKIFTEGFKVPEPARCTPPSSRPAASSAATWSATAAPHPVRMHIRAPSS